MKTTQDIRFLKLQGPQISQYILEIARLRIEIFRDFPYLYEGDLEYEEKYLEVYENSENSLIVLALDRDVVIGATTALPLADENAYVKDPFRKANFPLENIFYFGESVLKKEYRGLGIGKKFFQFREDHTLSFGRYNITSFCAVNRPSDHKYKPSNYVPLDTFWINLGYNKEPKLVSFFSWKDIGDSKETFKPMTYWLKKWN